MTKGNRPPRSGDEEVVILNDGGGRDELARALAEAERAVAAVEERQRRSAGAGSGPPDGEAPPGADGGPAGAMADDRLVADLQRRLMEERSRAESAEEDAGRMREALLRTAADFENLKRRTEREKADHFRYALSEVLRDLLGVLDNLERAVLHAGEGAGSELLSGVEMTVRQFLEALRRQGVQEVEALGAPFDPNVHAAVMREETAEAPPGTVLDVYQKGYLLNERLLRPAMVKVSAAVPGPSRSAAGPGPDVPTDTGPGEGD